VPGSAQEGVKLIDFLAAGLQGVAGLAKGAQGAIALAALL
jgi:hypothetical protein